MAIANLITHPDLEQRVLDLQQCFLLEPLSPEELYVLARYGQTKVVNVSEAEKNLTDLEQNMVFVAEGRFEKVYFKDEESTLSPAKAVVLADLGLGDYWGEHFLLQDDSLESTQIQLRSKAAGRLILIGVAQFNVFLSRWTSIQTVLVRDILKQAFKQSLALGLAQSQLQNTDAILNRIESVAEFLSQQNTTNTDNKKNKQIQNKYLLKEKPDLTKILFKDGAALEQAYLEGSDKREDRIRMKNKTTFTRTTKTGKGGTRMAFERDITAPEYEQLMKRKEGRKIIKTRFISEEKIDGVSITVDKFLGEGNLEGLWLLELDFDNEEAKENFTIPVWLKKSIEKEVTTDTRYGNRSLAKNGRPH